MVAIESNAAKTPLTVFEDLWRGMGENFIVGAENIQDSVL